MQIKNKSIVFKIIFSLVGLMSLIKIIMNYGPAKILEEINHSGFSLVLLVFSFVPTLVCYSISWLLATDHNDMKMNLTILQKIALFFKFTIISIAWNNLTPFLKVGGEPLKYLMLQKYLPKDKALSSTVNYNVIHLLSTGISFLITAFCLIVLYPVPTEIQRYLIGFILISLILFFVGMYFFNYKWVLLPNRFKHRKLRIAFSYLKESYSKLLNFYKTNHKVFLISVSFDVVARFIEGLTFYFAFNLINHPIGVLTSSLMDVGRTFVDTLFFFVPYQIGSREEGVRVFMEKVLSINSYGFLTAVFFYRFVEIFWIVVGYVLWLKSSNSKRRVIE